LWSSSSGQQAVRHVAAGQPRVSPGGARRDPCHQVIEQARVRGMIYAGSSSGCRQISLFRKPHDRSSRAGFPHLRASAASMPVQPGTPARPTAVNCNDEAPVTIYNCRNSVGGLLNTLTKPRTTAWRAARIASM
jgi:hypothetical protein